MGGAYLEAEPEFSLRPCGHQRLGDKRSCDVTSAHRNGTPRGKDWRAYYKLSMAERRQVPAPAHKKREKRAGGTAPGTV